MEAQVYRKQENEVLDREFEASMQYGKVRAAKHHIFYKKGLRWMYVSMEGVVRLFRRINEVSSRVGCCSNDFSIHTLILVYGENGQESQMEIQIGQGLYRHEPEHLMEALAALYPDIPQKKQA